MQNILDNPEACPALHTENKTTETIPLTISCAE